mmetsp:Transcript_7709/g.18926  ORF Transcript_7709/g.18926 Transcript_7709/m.18926 type:complete len:104 (-) Transcript_7709:1049-1360(-)
MWTCRSRYLKTQDKTRLCEFLKLGSCPRGAECTFAHGRKDLRLTKMCDSVINGMVLVWRRLSVCLRRRRAIMSWSVWCALERSTTARTPLVRHSGIGRAYRRR